MISLSVGEQIVEWTLELWESIRFKEWVRIMERPSLGGWFFPRLEGATCSLMIQSSGRWGQEPDPDPGPDPKRFRMSQTDWFKISGGRLQRDNKTIIKNASYQVVAFVDEASGTGTLRLVDVS